MAAVVAVADLQTPSHPSKKALPEVVVADEEILEIAALRVSPEAQGIQVPLTVFL